VTQANRIPGGKIMQHAVCVLQIGFNVVRHKHAMVGKGRNGLGRHGRDCLRPNEGFDVVRVTIMRGLGPGKS
jgi:hypothetical protein